MTYTEFIKMIENNIAKANCNKLNIGEYEEKQEQLYNQIRAEAIDDCLNILKIHKNNWDGIEWAIRDIEKLKERINE